MQLLITRQTVAQRRVVRPGEVVDVSESEGRLLKAAGKAVDHRQALDATHHHARCQANEKDPAMIEQNIGTYLQTINLLPMQSVTGDGNGTGVDCQQFVGRIAVLLSAKNTAGTTPTLDVKLQSSPDNSTWADISGATFTQVTDANTSAATLEKIVVNIDAADRYVRAVKDIGGTNSPAFNVACVAVGIQQVL